MTEHFIFVFIYFVIFIMPLVNFLQLQKIIKKLDKDTN